MGTRLSLATLAGFVPFLSRGIAMRADALAVLPWSIRNQERCMTCGQVTMRCRLMT
jgi:hypothetical protein